MRLNHKIMIAFGIALFGVAIYFLYGYLSYVKSLNYGCMEFDVTNKCMRFINQSDPCRCKMPGCVYAQHTNWYDDAKYHCKNVVRT